MRNGLKLALVYVALNVGCAGSEAPPPGAEATGVDRRPIVGLAPREEPTAVAADLTSRDISGAVAFVFGNGHACSAIAPSVLLTAAHCTYPPPTTVRFDQAPNELFDIIDTTVHPGYDSVNMKADLALLWLDRPVSKEIVRRYPRVFLGRIDQALRDGPGVGFSDDGLIVGCGLDTTCYDPDCDGGMAVICHDGHCELVWSSVGTRRSGIARDVGISPFSGMVFHEAKESQEETVNHGDSGGPIFLQAGPQSEYYIVGVGSYISYEGNNQLHAYWAPTGSLEVSKIWSNAKTLYSANAEWLAAMFAPSDGDADADRVPDDVDNCPPSRCIRLGWPIERCNNPTQTDDDGDLVGDACDNCPPSECRWANSHAKRNLGFFWCTNPDGPDGLQPDFDGDGIGDRCDLCPDVYTYPIERHLDSDRDMIGDACDWCPDETNPMSECTVDADCNPPQGGTNRCFIIFESPTRIDGRCARLYDGDRDGIPDACDNCTAKENHDQRNSNRPAEIGVLPNSSPLGDVCDDIPLFRLDEQTPDRLEDFSRPVQGRLDGNAAEATVLHGASWLSKGAQTIPGNVTFFSDRVAFRYCGCYEDGSLVLSDRCDDVCDAGEAYKAEPGLGWHPTVVGKNGDPLPNGLLQTFVKGKAGPTEALVWNWYPLTKAAKDPLPTHPCEGSCQFDAENDRRVSTRVRLASAVLNWKRDLTPLDYDTEGRLRVVVAHYDLPNIERRLDDLKLPLSRCQGFGCHIWMRWWDAVMKPEDIRTNIPDVVLLARDGDQGHWVLGAPNGDVLAFADHVGEVGKIVDSFGTYLSPVESGPLLRSRGVPSQMLFVSRSSMRPHLIGIRPEGLVVDSAPIGIGSDDEEASMVRVPDGGAAVFSALERTLIIVGGDSPADLGIVRRYHIDSDRLEGLAFGPSGPAADVRGVAYDVIGKILYALEVDEAKGIAQIKSYDFGTRGSRVEWESSLKNTDALLGLGLDPEGHLLLVRAFEKEYSVWRTVLPASNEVRFGTIASGTGFVLDHPVADDYELVLPVRDYDTDALSLRPLAPNLFVEAAPCCDSL